MSVEVFDLDIDKSSDKFIDKTSVIYGESGTGKSFLIVHILYSLKSQIDQCVVFSPTDRQNHTYDRGLIPLPLIHYTMTEKILDDIWMRQEALAATYTKSNNPETLLRLYSQIPHHLRSESDKLIDSIRSKLAKYTQDVSDEGKIAQMKESCEDVKIKIYKQLISANESTLSKLRLDNDLSHCLKYQHINPRIVLIFDDCTDLIKKFRNTSVMQRLFYQGRHAMITALIACHTDKSLDSELKKNAAVSIFTEKSCAAAYFTRPSTNLDKEAQQRALSACRLAFDTGTAHQKLCWVRHEKKFYKLVAVKKSNFRFCNDVIWDYAAAAEIESGKISGNNPFIHSFK